MEPFPFSIPENQSQKDFRTKISFRNNKIADLLKPRPLATVFVRADKANSLDEDRVDTKASSSAVRRRR